MVLPRGIHRANGGIFMRMMSSHHAGSPRPWKLVWNRNKTVQETHNIVYVYIYIYMCVFVCACAYYRHIEPKVGFHVTCRGCKWLLLVKSPTWFWSASVGKPGIFRSVFTGSTVRTERTSFRSLRSMLDLLTIFSATGLQQDLEAAKGEKSLMMRQARGPGFVVPILSCQNESRWNDLSNSGPWIFWSRIIVKWCQVIWCIYIYISSSSSNLGVPMFDPY